MGDRVDFAAEFEGALRELREQGVGYEIERQPIPPFQIANFEEAIGVRVPVDLRRCMLELGCVHMRYERENGREGSFAIHDLVHVVMGEKQGLHSSEALWTSQTPARRALAMETPVSTTGL